MSRSQVTPPDALLLMAPGCAHCPVVLEGLTRLLKEGRIGRLEVVSVAAHPEAAQAAGTRSVPWTRIGPFALEGRQSPAELARWAQHAGGGTGMTEYLAHLIEARQLDTAVARVREAPGRLVDLLGLAASLDTPMGVRIGIAAIVEDLQGSPALRIALPTLGALAASDAPAIRADAAHWLGLTGSAEAAAALHPLLEDADPEVREIAAESLALLPVG